MKGVIGGKKMRQTLKAAADANITALMKNIAGNPIKLAEVVAGGPFNWRLIFLRAFHGLPVNDHVANLVFRFFCEQFLKQYPGVTATQFLDKVEVRSPLTAKDIEDSWEHTVDSSEEGRRRFYKDMPGPPITVH
jgi:hypothetical protein